MSAGRGLVEPAQFGADAADGRWLGTAAGWAAEMTMELLLQAVASTSGSSPASMRETSRLSTSVARNFKR